MRLVFSVELYVGKNGFDRFRDSGIVFGKFEEVFYFRIYLKMFI